MYFCQFLAIWWLHWWWCWCVAIQISPKWLAVIATRHWTLIIASCCQQRISKGLNKDQLPFYLPHTRNNKKITVLSNIILIESLPKRWLSFMSSFLLSNLIVTVLFSILKIGMNSFQNAQAVALGPSPVPENFQCCQKIWNQ